MRILGVHGINNLSRSKNSFTDKILAALSSDYQVVDVQSPRMSFWMGWIPWSRDRRADKLLEVYQPGDVIVAHSAGCLLTILALRRGMADIPVIFLFAGAVEDDVEFPDDGYGVIYNIHSKLDKALKLGRWLPKHPFGDLGLTGYVGKNKNVINVDAGDLQHNDHVDAKHFCFWINFIKSTLKKEVAK